MLLRKIIFVVSILLIGIGFALYKPDIPLDELKSRYANEQSQFIEVQGMNVHYRIEGEGEPLLLIHGTGASLHTWDDWVEVLKKDFQVIRLDLPAYGLTGPSPEGNYTYEYYAGFINSFLEQLGISRCHVAGNSLGGGITWTFALLYPDKADKLILVDASGFPKDGKSPWIFRLAKNPIAGPLMKNLTPRFIFQSNLEAVYHQDSLISESLVDRYFDLARRAGNRDAFVDRSKVHNPDRTDQLAQIENETLIMWGAHDDWIPVGDATKFDQALPNSSVVIYENAGHVPMEEIPQVTARDARRFLLK